MGAVRNKGDHVIMWAGTSGAVTLPAPLDARSTATHAPRVGLGTFLSGSVLAPMGRSARDSPLGDGMTAGTRATVPAASVRSSGSRKCPV
ncbi:hypothetical protein PV341_24470 [Streptomyces sp. PA03-1a]|nr:hypothetical protein [Streptomyces sp. PA03-1a]MDX2812747.1 hypothetical protein [Streptomyces sp. PA03-5A]